MGSQRDALEWDVVICGGTLGILPREPPLAQRGWRVALLERGVLTRARPGMEYFAQGIAGICRTGAADGSGVGAGDRDHL